MLIIRGRLSFTLVTTEEVCVFHVWEVDIVVSMCVRVRSWIVSVVLPERVGSHICALTVVPGLKLKISDGTVSVEIRDRHSALVSIIVNHFSTEIPLLLFAETFEDMIWAYLHNTNFLTKALILTFVS